MRKQSIGAQINMLTIRDADIQARIHNPSISKSRLLHLTTSSGMSHNILTTEETNVVAEDQPLEAADHTSSSQSRQLDSIASSSYTLLFNEENPHLRSHIRDQEGLRMNKLTDVTDAAVTPKDQKQTSKFNYSSFESRPNNSIKSLSFRYVLTEEGPDLYQPGLNDWRQGLELFQEGKSSNSNMTADGHEKRSFEHLDSLIDWKQGLKLFREGGSLNTNITVEDHKKHSFNHLADSNDWKKGLELFQEKRISLCNI